MKFWRSPNENVPCMEYLVSLKQICLLKLIKVCIHIFIPVSTVKWLNVLRLDAKQYTTKILNTNIKVCVITELFYRKLIFLECSLWLNLSKSLIKICKLRVSWTLHDTTPEPVTLRKTNSPSLIYLVFDLTFYL